MRTLVITTLAAAGLLSLADQSATEVRIRMGPQAEPKDSSSDDRVCTAAETPKPVTVALDAPLGDRKVFLAA